MLNTAFVFPEGFQIIRLLPLFFGGKGFYFGGKDQDIIFYRTENIYMKPTNRLTELSIKQAKPKEKQYKLTDGEGMYLRVYPNGSKYWQL